MIKCDQNEAITYNVHTAMICHVEMNGSEHQIITLSNSQSNQCTQSDMTYNNTTITQPTSILNSLDRIVRFQSMVLFLA